MIFNDGVNVRSNTTFFFSKKHCESKTFPGLHDLNFKMFGRFHKQLGVGKLNVRSPSKECRQLLKEKQEENAKASNEALEWFEVAFLIGF